MNKKIILTVIIIAVMVMIAALSIGCAENNSSGAVANTPKPNVNDTPADDSNMAKLDADDMSNEASDVSEPNANAAPEPRNAADALRFKEEHEVYNGQLRDNGQPHLEIYIPANNRVVYLEFDELMRFFESGTGVFFFSRPT